MSSVIITAIVTSILTSILVGRIILLLQYKSTNAGHRLYKVATATRELTNTPDAADPRTGGAGRTIGGGRTIGIGDPAVDALLTRHRYSLGVLIYRCHLAFGRNGKRRAYPVLHDGPDRWAFFNEHVRPVIQDINNNSFIGWLPTAEMRRLRAVVALCDQVENILSEMTTEDQHHGQLVIDALSPQSEALVRAYEKFRQYWLHWLALLPPVRVTHSLSDSMPDAGR